MAKVAAAHRLYTVLTFVGLGPALGGLGVLAFFLCLMLTDPSASAVQAASLTFGASLMFLVFGYWFGAAPALLTGLLYAFAPPRFQRVLLSPLFGLVSVWLVDKVADVATGGSLGGGDLTMMLIAGALSSIVCAYCARAWGFTRERQVA